MKFNKPTKKINKLLHDIAKSKAYVKHIVLPDLHYKPQMEAPSSTAISTGKYIVPSLASAAINDGMSIIKLPFKKEDLTDEIIKDFLHLEVAAKEKTITRKIPLKIFAEDDRKKIISHYKKLAG